MTDANMNMSIHRPSNDNRSLQANEDYITRIRKEWRDLEEATADIWELPPNDA